MSALLIVSASFTSIVAGWHRFYRDYPELGTSHSPPPPLERTRSGASTAFTQTDRRPALPSSYSYVDEYLRREHDREIRNLDRTIREAEAHRQRIADFLAEAENTTSRLLAERTTRDRPEPVPSISSSYSTLRGALDDTAIRSGATSSLRRRPSARPQNSVLSTETRESNLRYSDDNDILNLERIHADRISRSRYISLTDLLSHTSQSIDTRPSDDVLDLSHHEADLPLDEPPYFAPAPSLPESSLLEANRRARMHTLSGLRRRARQRSPSPPLPSTTSTSLFSNAFETIEPSLRPSASHTASSFTRMTEVRAPERPPRRFTGLFVSDDSRPYYYGPPPAQPPPPDPVPPPAPVLPSRPRRYDSIDLNAYRDGPFRATLARSMALQSQIQGTHERAEAEERPVSTRPRSRVSRDALTALLDDSSSSEEDTILINRPAPRHFYSLQRTMRDEHVRALADRARADLLDRAAPRATTSSINSHRQPHLTSRPQYLDQELSRPELAPSTTGSVDSIRQSTMPESEPRGPTERLLELIRRPSITPSGTSTNTSSAVAMSRYRTLLGREHSLSGLHGSTDGSSEIGSDAARAARRHELRARVAMRGGSRLSFVDPLHRTYMNNPGSSISGSTPATTAPHAGPGVREADPAHSHAHPHAPHHPPIPSIPGPRRAWQARNPPGPGLREERAAPLNGRFARTTRGFASHLPPDMVWVGLQPSGPGANRTPGWRRRFMGDFMVRCSWYVL